MKSPKEKLIKGTTMKKVFCHHQWKFIRYLYGDEYKSPEKYRYGKEFRCEKCGKYKWE